MLGEARMVAREIKGLLLSGVPADDILVTLREILPYADLIREVFSEYGVPIDLEGTEPLSRNPAVSTLLRAMRLPQDDWPFAGVTALLRSDYFQPDWAETESCPDVVQKADALLRLVGEPRGKNAYLRAVDVWADQPPAPLDDEQADESRRRRTQELARTCRPFLQRFFKIWEEVPARGTLVQHAGALRGVAATLGLERADAQEPLDAAALNQLWEELERWIHLDRQLRGGDHIRDAGQFQRILAAIAAEAGLARTPRGPGRVRVLSAPLARSLTAPYVFVMGLGERSFPRLAVPEPFFEESQRQSFKEAGLDFACARDLLPDEMLLFYQVVTRARQQLILSYPAVDDKGQELLPSSFLNTLVECFHPGTISTHERRMLIEGYDRDPPLSPAEFRVRLAAAGTRQPVASRDVASSASGSLLSVGGDCPPIAADLKANLNAALRMVQARFHERDYGIYDGLLRHPSVAPELLKLVGPEKIFSPTALEDYVACPFRFFMGQVLRLETLEEPREEIESTQRGRVFHLALAHLHQHLKEAGIHEPEAAVDAFLQERVDAAVNEFAERASPASAVLWKLEGERLRRIAARYRPHWVKFLEPWIPAKAKPRPEFLEKSFGMDPQPGEEPAKPLVIVVDGVEVRLRGRIDRVDVADLEDGLGFWVIDYKTGRSEHYTAEDLQSFQRLQLTLYALAVEQVLLAGKKARPLGMAYWLVAGSGHKVALPADRYRPTVWLEQLDHWPAVRDTLERWVTTLVRNIREGTFPLKPRSKDCTARCEFAQVCRISQSRSVDKAWELPLPVIETPEHGSDPDE
jgi:ATP-dependent helicase/DNAse subunit B